MHRASCLPAVKMAAAPDLLSLPSTLCCIAIHGCTPNIILRAHVLVCVRVCICVRVTKRSKLVPWAPKSAKKRPKKTKSGAEPPFWTMPMNYTNPPDKYLRDCIPDTINIIRVCAPMFGGGIPCKLSRLSHPSAESFPF